jgi:hypothetical protein
MLYTVAMLHTVVQVDIKALAPSQIYCHLTALYIVHVIYDNYYHV